MKRTILILIIHCTLFSIHCYSQQGQWTWMNGSNAPNPTGVYGTQTVFAIGNTPPGLYEACQYTDQQGSFWIFGGLSNSSNDRHGDLWKFNPVTNQWAWMKGPGVPDRTGIYGTINVPSPTNNPGGRGWGMISWVDNNNNLWLYGGYGYDADSSYGDLGDLWEYDISTNNWTWKNGSNLIMPAPVYGTEGIPAPANTPGGRCETNCSWVDANNNLWMYGGFLDAGDAGSDLWMYNISTNEWAWESGSSISNATPVYGTKTVPDPANFPGGRRTYTAWKSSNDDLWLFGGTGLYTYNDMWRYNIASNEWTWMSGSNLTNAAGDSGANCVPDTGYYPSSRYEDRACWTLGCDNFVNYGSTTDDLWNFSVSTLQWTCMNGTANTAGTVNYGIINVSSPTNNPGDRWGSLGFKDLSGNLWLFGGDFTNYRNDMWKFVVDTTCPHLSGTGGPITSAFTATPVNGCNPLTVTFSNASVNSTNYVWNFGDNSGTNTSNNPTHTYTDTGTFTVTLIAINNSSCGSGADTLKRSQYIHVTPSAHLAFTAVPDSGCSPLTVHFTSDSIVGVTSYLWAFGDGGTANSINPVYTYHHTGIDTVSVIGYAANGCNDTVQYIAIRVDTIPIVTTGFTASPLSGCNPLSVSFTNTTTNGVTYIWSFGDTDTSSAMNPTHLYTDTGYFTVTLLAINPSPCGLGKDTTVRTQYIHVTPSAHVSFSADTIYGCNPLTVLFHDSATNVTSLHWNFGDTDTSNIPNPSHIYATTGTFDVTLIGYTANGCNDTVTFDSIVVIPVPVVASAFTPNPILGCNPLTVSFTNSSTNGHNYIWKFGDTTTDTLTNPTHLYPNAGTYPVTLYAIDTSFCGVIKDSSTQTITVYAQATAAFMPDTQLGCVPFNVGFTNSSTNATSYLWDFGDTHSSNSLNPVNTYSVAGTYTVTLIAYGAGGCNDTISKSYISVINPPVVTSPFTSDTFQGCNPLTINFTNNGSDATNYLWRFGDGASGTTFNATHTYTDSGEFTVTLVMINDTSICGLYTDSTVKPEYILVADPIIVTSKFTVSPLNGCTPLMVTITNNSTNGASYIWNFGNGESMDTSKPPPIYYLDSGTYHITLVASNYNSRCYNAPDSMSVEITVDSCNLYVPNAFSPNGDGKNDFFELNAEGYSNYHLIIFDRWGLKVFESTNAAVLWNGLINNTGGQCPDGTYYYIFTATDFYNTPVANHGFLTLIR